MAFINHKNPFDAFLANYFILEDTRASSFLIESEAELIFNKKFENNISTERINKLISDVSNELSKQTLGNVITSAIFTMHASGQDLQQKTGLTPSLIEAVKTDMVFTNSIPVRSLVKLIKMLNISVDKVKEAIDVTFDKLSVENKLFNSIPADTMPAFRKGFSHQDITLEYKSLKSDESYLYQNKEALNLYTKRLSELYNEI